MSATKSADESDTPNAGAALIPAPVVDPAAFAVLPEGRLTWAIASIFGERERLESLHAQLAERLAPRDNLVYLGNVLGRGDVAGTVQELLLFRREQMARQLGQDGGDIVYLRGSQEEMWHKLLQLQFAPDPGDVLEWMLSHGLGATLDAYGGRIDDGRTAAKLGAVALSRWTNHLRAGMRAIDGHERLMNVLRRAAFTRDRAILLVNAGIDPRRPLSAQTDSFWWGGCDFEAIVQPFDGFTRIVRGADARRHGVVIRDVIASIDGGCGFGGPLVAACFDPSGHLVDMIEP